MLVVSGVITLDPSDRDAALEAAATAVTATLEEDGCITYGFWADPGDPGRFRVFEEWASPEALMSHFAQPHMATFLEAMGALQVISTDVQQYTVTDKRPVGT